MSDTAVVVITSAITTVVVMGVQEWWHWWRYSPRPVDVERIQHAMAGLVRAASAGTEAARPADLPSDIRSRCSGMPDDHTGLPPS